jgi:hypothetical protein
VNTEANNVQPPETGGLAEWAETARDVTLYALARGCDTPEGRADPLRVALAEAAAAQLRARAVLSPAEWHAARKAARQRQLDRWAEEEAAWAAIEQEADDAAWEAAWDEREDGS